MVEGHGNDKYKYGEKITCDFSSNIPGGINHQKLYAYLNTCLHTITDYPNPTAAPLVKELCSIHHIGSENICVTNGATESIYLIAQRFAGHRSVILAPTFSEYADACKIHKHQVSYISTIQAVPKEAELIWLCNPNNPTGTVIGKDELMQLMRQYPDKIWVMDQSYEALCQHELFTAREAQDYPNLFLLHSLTKEFAIPGLRLGYTTANASLIRSLAENLMPWNVNQVAILAGSYLLAHKEDYALDKAFLLAERKRISDALGQIPGIQVVEGSRTNFFLAKLKDRTAQDLKEYLAEKQGILIRDCSNFQGLDAHYFRIAIQSPESNDKLIQAIKAWRI